MEAVRVKLLGKVENLVCRILRSFSTVIKGGVTSTTSEGSVILNNNIREQLCC
jgi:hypothetical protein